MSAAEALYDRDETEVTPPPRTITSDSGEVLLTGFVIIADFNEVDIDPEITVKLLDLDQFKRLVVAA